MARTMEKPELQGALSRVLEELVFALVEPADGMSVNQGQLLLASLRFSGADSGLIQLAVPEVFARQLAADWMGLETSEEVSDALMVDAVGELSNVFAGEVLDTWFSEQRDYELETPQVSRIEHVDVESVFKASTLSAVVVTELAAEICGAIQVSAAP